MPPKPVTTQLSSTQISIIAFLYRSLVVLLPLVALVVVLLFPNNFLLVSLCVGLGCLDLFLLPAFVGNSYTSVLAQTYRGFGVIVAWLTQDIAGAALILLTGIVLGFAIEHMRLKRLTASTTPSQRLAAAVDATIQTGLTLFLTWLAYSLVGGAVPLYHISGNMLPVIVMLGTYILVSELSRYLVLHMLRGQPYEPIWAAHKRNDLFSAFLVLPMIVILPVMLAGNGASLFLLTVLVIIGLGLYQFQTYTNLLTSQQDRQKSAELVRKLALVNQTAQNAMFRVDQELALQTACTTAASITQADRVALFVTERDSDMLSLVESIGFSEAELGYGLNLYFGVNQQFDTAAFIVQDAVNDQSPNPLAEFNRHLQVASFATLPLLSGSALLGYLAIYHNQPHEYNPTELELVNILTDRVAAALDNAHLLDTLEFHAFEMTHLVHLSRISTASLKLEQVAADVTSVLRQMSAMDWAMIALLDDAYALMNVVGFSGITTNSEVETFQYKLPQFSEVINIRNQAVPRPRFIRSDEVNLSAPLRSYMEIHALRSLVIAPMLAHERTFGVVFLGTTAVRVLT